MKNLLLIAESFPPLNNIASQRFPPMLKVLEENGWRVWVLTQNGSGDLPVPLPEAQIIRIGRHHQADARVSEGSRFAARAPVNAAVRAAVQGCGIKLHTVNSTLVSWYRTVMRDLPIWRRQLQGPPDVVLGTYPPPAALWLAQRLASEFGVPWIADFRDLAALRRLGRPAYAYWLDRRIEARLLRSAAAVTTCGKGWAEMLRTAYHRPTRVLYNGFDHTLLAAADPCRPPPDLPAGLFLYYAGRFYERQMAAVERLLEAVRDTPFRIVVRSLGPPDREKALLARARELGVANKLKLRPPVPVTEVVAEAAHASANLVLETIAAAEDWTRGHYSGKFLQLVPLRPPVIYVGRPDAEAGDVLRHTGKGVLCTTVGEIHNVLERVAAGERWPGEPAAIETYAKSRQGERLLELVEEVCPALAGRPLSAGAAGR